MLLHVLDCATLEPGRDPISDLDAHRGRAGPVPRARFGDLLARPRLVALNKVDVPEGARAGRARAARTRGARAARSSRSRPSATRGCASCPSPWPRPSRPTGPARPAPEAGPDRAAPAGGRRRRVHRQPDPAEPGGFVVRGDKPERWVRQTELRQRRGRRLPGRPAGPPRRRGRAGQAGRGAGRGRHHRRRSPSTSSPPAGSTSRSTRPPAAAPTSGWRHVTRPNADERLGGQEGPAGARSTTSTPTGLDGRGRTRRSGRDEAMSRER